MWSLFRFSPCALLRRKNTADRPASVLPSDHHHLVVVMGKYLALLVVYLIPLAIISLYPLVFSQFGDVYLPVAYGSLAAFFFLGAALIALGVFISSRPTTRALRPGSALR